MNIFTSPRALLVAGAALFSLGLSAQTTLLNDTEADELNYQRTITDAEARQAMGDLSQQLATARAGFWYLRGSKDARQIATHSYQVKYSLSLENYAQYSCVTHRDYPYSPGLEIPSTYSVNKAMGGGGGLFTDYRTTVVPLMVDSRFNNLPEFKAICLLFYDYGAVENSDMFGPLPYKDFKKNKSSNPFTYNKQSDIYYTAVANIDKIIACLRYYEGNRTPAYKTVLHNVIKSSCDLIPNGDYHNNLNQWIHFANALKLRYAIHISKVDPVSAQKWAEEAADPANGGLMADKPQEQVLVGLNGATHPVVEIQTSWHDNVLGASFVSILESLDHPFAKYMFDKNSDPILKVGTQGSAPQSTGPEDRLIGMRNGTSGGIGQAVASNSYVAMSKVKAEFFGQQNPPMFFMKLSEQYFNLAEAALRGWDVRGTAKDFYEKGVRNAAISDPAYVDEDEYKNYVDEYMSQSAAKDYTYVDPTGNTPDMPSVTKIGVAWDDNLPVETKLEMIITQKYIAAYPNPTEPWLDMRRTGYPKVFPVINTADGDGSLHEGDQIRRIPWNSTDPSTIDDINNTGIPNLGGADQMATRLWWDTTAGNFPTGINTVNSDRQSVEMINGNLVFEGVNKVDIYDTTGRIVKTIANPGNVSTQSMPRGLYIIKTTGALGTQTQKFMTK
ncbi:SusD/RagB family nutrient-binding outer membrane lipoprotein [Hallella seregens]|uniref:SusD/RagB family nutrient-binding outer membrane lipoprotein n=1 Tax=Hallella seregens ATCC 51272 TaxID=1336250 RepID=A0ABV5ZMN0_9BACT|nr:SusD/RagB family nutrient-binding outer membrane lipoprotein [Hallella seregens]